MLQSFSNTTTTTTNNKLIYKVL